MAARSPSPGRGVTRAALLIVVLTALLVAQPLVLIQGTPRAQDWPWVVLVGVAGAWVIVVGVPFALRKWAGRFPDSVARGDRIAGRPWLLVAWAVGLALAVAFGDSEMKTDAAILLVAFVLPAAWRLRRSRRQRGWTE